MKKLLLLVLGSTLLSACAQLEIITPNPRVEPPETRGEEWKWKIGGTASSSHRYKATENAGRRPPDLTNTDVSGHFDFAPTTYFSLAPRYEMGLEYNLLGRGLSLLGKLQVWGDGTLSAKKGNVPIALFARAGQVNGDESGDQSETFGAGGYKWSGTIKTNFVQGGLSGGYRATDWLLIYGGAAYGKYWADVKIDQKLSDNGTSPAASYSKDATADGYTVSGGVMFSWRKLQTYVVGELVTIDYNDHNVMKQESINAGVFFTP